MWWIRVSLLVAVGLVLGAGPAHALDPLRMRAESSRPATPGARRAQPRKPEPPRKAAPIPTRPRRARPMPRPSRALPQPPAPRLRLGWEHQHPTSGRSNTILVVLIVVGAATLVAGLVIGLVLASQASSWDLNSGSSSLTDTWIRF